MFVFGYVTCKMLYYIRATRISIQLLQLSNLVSLFLLTRALENFEHSRALCLKDLKQRDASERNIDIYKSNLNEEIESFKNKSISGLLELHPDFFKQVIPYDDWDSAMKYLESNKNVIVTTYLQK
tara:strand:- start:433 stop:807 length:375 start_codon:yes stop_codon:yes gene_type:complete